jgi:hypothetical protein
METKEIKVGDYIRGFKYHCPEDLAERMNSYVGKIAKVIITPEDYTIKVKFSDGQTYWYPKHQALEHLCNNDMKDFEKGLDANAKDSMKALDTLVIDKTISEMLTDADILKETPFHKPDFSHLKDIDKYLDEKAKNSGLNKTPIEELESHFKDPKLYSVLLSLGKMRMVYIDQTDEDVEQIKKQSPNWHTIIVEQQQDKGIQIIIKS